MDQVVPVVRQRVLGRVISRRRCEVGVQSQALERFREGRAYGEVPVACKLAATRAAGAAIYAMARVRTASDDRGLAALCPRARAGRRCTSRGRNDDGAPRVRVSTGEPERQTHRGSRLGERGSKWTTPCQESAG